jgi:hypothetical protein
MTAATVVRRLAARWPLDPDPDADLVDAVDALEADVAAATVVAAADAGATAVLLAAAPLVWLSPALGLAVALAAVGLAVGARRLPVAVADVRRSRRRGDATTLVVRAALRMRLAPTTENAAAFAARADGPLAARLRRHVRGARARGTDGLDGLESVARDDRPALDRAVSHLRTAAAVSPDERESVLDDAVRELTEATREETSRYAADLRMRTTALYAFGVLLPLALVGVLPAARVAGATLPLAAVVLCYDVGLPVGLAAAGTSLLAERPTAFPPPSVGLDHPDVPDRRRHAVVCGAAAAGLAGAAAAVVVGPWTVPLASAGAGLGVALLVVSAPATAVRDRVGKVERGLPTVLRRVGARVERGDSVEAALADVPAGTPAGDAVAAATERLRLLGVGVREAFLGADGPLAAVPSRRVGAAVDFLALAAAEGPPAGAVLRDVGDHLRELDRLERSARRDLATVTGTLANTATVFGPLVAGATVAMARRVTAAEATGDAVASSFPTAALGVAVGAYVLLLAVVLVVLATGLERGLDRWLLARRVGVALPTATASFLGAVVAGRLLVSV